jgi:oligoribonuclease (3'-5' exoribonuclease)
MKYVSLDLETTCLDPKQSDRILQVSMIVEDTENIKPLDKLPHFTCFVAPKTITGDAYALGMNGWILDIISGRAKGNHPIYKGDDWIAAAGKFLYQNFKNEFHSGKFKIPVAGKNVASFDLQFLPSELSSLFHYKTIDPTSVFWEPNKDGKLLGLYEIKEKLGIKGEVTHDAYDDALDVIKTLRKKYGKK